MDFVTFYTVEFAVISIVSYISFSCVILMMNYRVAIIISEISISLT